MWNVYTRSWTRGFEIAEVVDDAYRLRRLSDGAVLAGVIAAERIRSDDVRLPPVLPAAG